MNTRTININVTTEEVQGMVDTFMHLHNTLHKGRDEGGTPPAANRLLTNAACMMLKVAEAHPDYEALKEASRLRGEYDPLQEDNDPNDNATAE